MKVLKERLNKVKLALESYEEGERKDPLKVTTDDINFIVGASDKLIDRIEKLEKCYENDFKSLNERLDKKNQDYQKMRKIMLDIDAKANKYKQVIRQVRLLSWWQKSKGLKAELKSLDENFRT